MAMTGRMDSRESRCRRQILRLRMLALRQDGAALPQQFATEVREATNAIVAEAEAMSRASFGAGDRPEPGAETFAWVRINRLAMAADHLVDAARAGDRAGLRTTLQRFDALTSAIWAVLG